MSAVASTETKGTTEKNEVGVAVERVVCDNCGRDDAELVTVGRDHEYPETKAGDWKLVKCRCGLLYLNPRPATSELDRIYPSTYYSYQIVEQRQKQAGGRGSLLRRYMDARAVERLSAYVRLVEAAAPGPYRILDIGCGDGTVLDQWREAFGGPSKVSTHGVEMGARAAAIAEQRGHRVMPKRIEECEFEDSSFDLVFSFHVVEHVSSPTSFMEGIHRAVKPSGYVVIETPNVDTVDYRWFADRHWGAYHFPRHFNIYDAASFEALANKTGFEVVRFEYVPSAVFWVWTLHSMMYDRFPKLADKLLPPVDVLLRGGPWIWGLMSVFTAVDIAVLRATGRTACMRAVLRKR